MVELIQGDILKAEAEALVNTVNCFGVMGRGIALQFKKAFPENFKAYKAVCDRKDLQPGGMLVFDLNRFESPRFIVNFPTKNHWKGKSRLEDIQSGLNALVQEIQARGIRSIAIPPLGCGLGGLDWQVVRPLIEKSLAQVPEVRVLLYEPKGSPKPEDMVNRTKRPVMTAGRAVLLGLMKRYLDGLMDVSVSLMEIHKLMYFMQETGEALRLNFTKERYGPYAKNLRHVLSHIEGHFITGYGDAEDLPGKQIEYCEQAMDEAKVYLDQNDSIQKRFDRVSNLIDGFESPYGLELLATVHWVATREQAITPESAITQVHAWNDHKQQIPERHILVAFNMLAQKGWVGETATA